MDVDPDRRTLIAADPYCRRLGIDLVDLEAGRAVVRMTVASDMVNFVGVGHGGAVFTLADAAMAAASNSGPDTGLAVHLDIDYVRAVAPGEVLEAEAVEEQRGRRLGLYRVTVRDRGGRIVAVAQGRVSFS
jgi:acyl-CoA thioesterase